jgi:SAM-dependent methyltransferase
VTGIDQDERSITLARASGQVRFPDIRYVQADFLAACVKPSSVDLITAVASLHHMDGEAALRKMADILRPRWYGTSRRRINRTPGLAGPGSRLPARGARAT